MPCVAYTELGAGYQCISCRSGHLLVLFTGTVLGNTHILHCQTLSVIPLPLVRPPLVFILSKSQSSGRLTNQSKHGYFFWQHLFPIQSVGIPQGGLCVSYAILADLTQETANYGSFFGYSLDMKIPVAKSFGFYQLAHNLYHVDVLCPQAC